ncbi:hypothetical protein PHMEG_0005306 [Phytophthora megakarya]|uniref:Uncharacterized protein n=1 Tax=Phytophthora megakarya TaxID=4795 RepID=A0A225WTP0_9STRA|nr:hypothetical protein PHMEG_0005306 [Phytophthora megakarya]
MAEWSKMTISTHLSPFNPNQTKLGTTDIVDNKILLSGRRDRCGRSDFIRLVGIYNTLYKLKRTQTCLQDVVELKQTRFTSAMIVVTLIPFGYCRLPEDINGVYEWLECVLTAFKYWHGSDYCHGEFRWRNIIRWVTFFKGLLQN